MNASEIKGHAQAHYHSFGLLLKDALVSGQPGAVHQFRVSLKRLFALMSFVSENMGKENVGKKEQLLTRLEPVYKKGGELRDMQVLMALPASLELIMPPRLYEYLYKRYQKRILKFNQFAQLDRILSEESYLSSINELIDQYYRGGQAELRTHIARNIHGAGLLLKKWPGKEWHEARRLIKQNYLLMQMAVMSDCSRFADEAIQASRQLEQCLGVWHDTLNLQRVIDKMLSDTSEEPLMLFRQQLEDVKITKEDEIREQVRDSFLFNN